MATSSPQVTTCVSRFSILTNISKFSFLQWVEGQGSGARIDKDKGEEEDTFDAMGMSRSVERKI